MTVGVLRPRAQGGYYGFGDRSPFGLAPVPRVASGCSLLFPTVATSAAVPGILKSVSLDQRFVCTQNSHIKVDVV